MSSIDAARHTRFASVDTFRGAVLALMLFTPATSAAGYAWLRHAEWDGLTASDWLFPTFLVTSGLSLSFLLRPRTAESGRPASTTYVRLIRRLVLLIVAGLVYNAYGDSWFDLGELRFTGVLQMIGIAGAVAAAAALAGRALGGGQKTWWIVALATAITLLYGVGLDVASCDPAGRCSPYLGIDTALLGDSHVYRAGQAGWDPEGIVTSIASSALVLYGFAAGVLLQRHGRASHTQTVARVAALAALCFAGGLVAAQWLPANKRLLTPAFVLLAAGTALAVFCIVYLLVDATQRASSNSGPPRAAWPFIALGRNALIVFLAERFLLQTARRVRLGDRSIQERLLQDVLPFGEPAVHLAYTAVLLVIVTLIVGVLHRRRLYLAL
ncbi:hypothetical protein [Candidatus Poriferisodalis sp.]|uniref:hypothetical protein n=1 Tax=Candidatus Poriferisodalis sp. TaxID=3101277 RepID=UPI003B01586B